MVEQVDIDKETRKADELTSQLVQDMLTKIEEMKELRKKVIYEKNLELAKLRGRYENRILKLANDVIKYEESAKALVGPKKFTQLRKEWREAHAKPEDNEKPERLDPLLREMKDITQSPD